MATHSIASLRDLAVRILTAHGVAEADAAYVAEITSTAESMGLNTHGMAAVPYICSQLGGPMNATAAPAVVKDKGATAMIDGNGAIGQLAMRLTLQLASAKAREFGIGMVGVRNSFWLGALGPFIAPLAADGFLVQAWAQSSACRDSAPVGGIDATFSTNPVALAIPTDDTPIVADFSTSSMSMGKMSQMAAKGERAAEAVFMDRDGNYTDDASVVAGGGSILFTGGRHFGHKGYALSLWCEALTAMSGGNCNNPDLDQRQSFNVTVIDREAFIGDAGYTAEMKRFLAHVRASRCRPGVDRIRLPGESSQARREAAESAGVELSDAMTEKLNAAAADAGVAGLS
jgi:L-lactate dehydrogenase